MNKQGENRTGNKKKIRKEQDGKDREQKGTQEKTEGRDNRF